MLKLIVFSVFLASAMCEETSEESSGTWTSIKVYPPIPMSMGCHPFKLSSTKYRCQCGQQKNVPMMELRDVEVPSKSGVYPFIAVTKEEEVMDVLLKPCYCAGKLKHHLVFRELNDNYMMVYTGDAKLMVAGLIAQKVPSISEIIEFESTEPELSRKEGMLLCHKGMLENQDSEDSNTISGSNGNSNKNTVLRFGPTSSGLP